MQGGSALKGGQEHEKVPVLVLAGWWLPSAAPLVVLEHRPHGHLVTVSV